MSIKQIPSDSKKEPQLHDKLNCVEEPVEIMDREVKQLKQSQDGKRKGENLKQEAAKKQKIDEEVEELKTHLQIFPNDEDDVYTEATPLALKDTNEAEPAEVEEVLKVVTATKLMTKAVTTATTPIIVAHVPKAKVKSKDKGKRILVEEPKPLKRQAQMEQDEAFARELEVELNANINCNEVIEQVKRKERQDNTIMRYQALKRKPITEAQARKNMMIYLKNMAGFKMDFFKDADEDVTLEEVDAKKDAEV
nr:hypothetical protein [Tanacetum cinerariifolium]